VDLPREELLPCLPLLLVLAPRRGGSQRSVGVTTDEGLGETGGVSPSLPFLLSCSLTDTWSPSASGPKRQGLRGSRHAARMSLVDLGQWWQCTRACRACAVFVPVLSPLGAWCCSPAAAARAAGLLPVPSYRR
jgi:hypothetical protein